MTTAPPATGAGPADVRRRPRPEARALRLVLLRLGDVGLQHLGDDRLPRPVPDRDRRGRRRRRRRLPFLGLGDPAGQLVLLRAVASVILQVLVLPLTGAIADRSGRKREMLAGFAILGALATTAMFFIADGRYLLGAGAVRRRQHLLRRGHGRLLLLAARPRRARRARRRLQPRLGLRLRRRGAAAGRPPRAVLSCRAPRPDRRARRCGSAWPRPASGGARSPSFTRVPAAQPPGPRSADAARSRSGFRQLGHDPARDAGATR